ncbi:uncharacterized protein LOC109884978 [Oncorhynchus kisutch]|uniref:uncharacterized protein LOC109884978 n=1 Tax=Oncorhynchus kisutch TaxID=8019 RepID=UPI0012DEBE3E|nr:uncharacterized protein LOC109884978 [Oncorhynchus kisutch]
MDLFDPSPLQRLALLVLWQGLALGLNSSALWYQVERRDRDRAVTWIQARRFCQSHYVDLAVLSTQDQYQFLLQTMAAGERDTFWLGLQPHTAPGGWGWKWVDGQGLSYDRWYIKSPGPGLCGCLETSLKGENKLLSRSCGETVERHGFICQGAVPPERLKAESEGTDHVTVHWDTPPLMQTADHSYRITTCSFQPHPHLSLLHPSLPPCHTPPLFLCPFPHPPHPTTPCCVLHLPYSNSSTSHSTRISGLTPGTQYTISVATVITRPDPVTGDNVTTDSDPVTVTVTTIGGGGGQPVVAMVLSVVKFIYLAVLLCLLYLILKRNAVQAPELDLESVELPTEEEYILDMIKTGPTSVEFPNEECIVELPPEE